MNSAIADFAHFAVNAVSSMNMKNNFEINLIQKLSKLTEKFISFIIKELTDSMGKSSPVCDSIVG